MNGFTIESGILKKHGVPVENPVTPVAGFTAFLEYLRKQESDGGLRLVAHNCFNFDARVLVSNLARFGVEASGEDWTFLDTLPVVKQYDPILHGVRGGGRLAFLMEMYLGEVETHDALDDALGLLRVVRVMANRKGIAFKELLDTSEKQPFSSQWIHMRS